MNEPPMLPPRWRDLAPLVDAVLDAPPGERAAVVLALTGGDPTRQRELEGLVAACERSAPLLDRPAAERFADLLDARDELLSSTGLGDRYRIERLLGQGGMARVYLAHDLKHARHVAVKVVRRDFAASLGRERFLREIGIAARLRHPNIVPLYDSGDADGLLYFVMPYEEGPSLRQRLGREPLPLAECVSLLRDIARALAYAHDHGVVHRDVKPDNVMLSGGAAVVTDFGIAKAVSEARTGSDIPATLTQVGAGIGTPAYMAPEQAMGDPGTDHRADIYAFGCVAYELFAGRPPFDGLLPHQLIAAHLSTAPTPVGTHRIDVPDAMAALIARCLEKSPDARPQRAQDLLRVCDEVAATGPVTPVTLPPPPPTRALRRWILPGVGAAMVALASSLVVLARGTGAPPALTLAVLPFGNIGADSAMGFIAEGLADEVASALQRVPGIQIKSRSGARAYRGQLTVDIAEAGEKLKADYLVNGVIRQDRGRWIVSAELARSADAASLWSANFHLDEDQQARAAEAMAASLTAALRSRFPRVVGSGTALSAQQQTTNSEAYRLYLRGQELLDRRGQSVRGSADLFREAIRLDPTYARAHAGLAMALGLFPYFQNAAVAEVRGDLEQAARRALALDSTLATPHVALGLLHWFDYQWEQAEREFRTAIALDGQDVEARVQYSRYLAVRGQAAAMEHVLIAHAQDPASAVVLSLLSGRYAVEGRMDSALAVSRRALEYDPTNFPALGVGAGIRLAAGLTQEARELVGRVPGFSTNLYVLAKIGDTVAVREQLRRLEAMDPPPADAYTARVSAYLGLGDSTKALDALERATERREIWHAREGPPHEMFGSIRGSARFQAILRRINYPR